MIDDKNIIEVGTNTISHFSLDDLIEINEDLSKSLYVKKNLINTYSKNQSWDVYRRFSNKYENVHMLKSINKMTPVSRSFFKLWEIIKNFEGKMINIKSPFLNCFFLAEGPGGFIEAFVKYRSFYSKNDSYQAITLRIPKDKSIPNWRENKPFMKNVKLTYGQDGTGDLYKHENIDFLANTYGNTMDFITGDGGFDFSANYNTQEETSFRLIIAEVITILRLQKYNGSSVLKIYDIFQSNTIKLIHLLKQFYNHVYFYKPLTSRPANSERYVICTEYKFSSDNELLKNVWESYKNENILSYLQNIPMDYNILNSIIKYNIYHTIRQCLYIEKTIDLIETQDDDQLKQSIQQGRQATQLWCEEYESS